MPKAGRKQRVLFVVAAVGLIAAIYILFKPVLPFFLPWKTYQSEQGFSITIPPNWYLNSDKPVMISEMKERLKPTRSPVTRIVYDFHTPIVSISTDVTDMTFEEIVASIKNGFEVAKDLGQPNQTVTEGPLTIDGRRAILLKTDPNFDNINIIHQALIIEWRENNNLIVKAQFIEYKVPAHQQIFHTWAIRKALTSIKFTK